MRQYCCDLDLPALAASQTPQDLAPIGASAEQALRRGDLETAGHEARAILQQNPGRIAALTVLYEVCKSSQRHRAAQALIRRIVALAPNHVWAIHELALMLLGQGALADAEAQARAAVRLAPANPQSHYLLAMALTESDQSHLGEYHYRRVIELTGTREPVVLSNLAWCLRNQGKAEQARALYQEALSASPDHFHALLGRARLEEADRDFDTATALLDHADRLYPANLSLILTRATILGRQKKPAAALALFDRVTKNGSRLGPGELLEKGRLLDQLGRYDEAFAMYVDGKNLLRQTSGIAYQANSAHAMATKLTRFFTADYLRGLPRARMRTDIQQPLFLLGFPRSGTSLLEQMLGSHPRIDAGGELRALHDVTKSTPRLLDSPSPYPDALAQLWMADHCDDLDQLRDFYLRQIEQRNLLSPDTAWFTDKMPLNEMHLGLIALLFANSPLIHMIRHPLDVVVSVFSRQLTHGYCCAYGLETIARHYVLIADLVDHYRREMTLRYLPVIYEDLVADPQTQLTRIFNFIGEAYDPNCLMFHENRRHARTASYAQVSEKLYDSSRFRYKNYIKHLETVIPILAPVMTRLGYSI